MTTLGHAFSGDVMGNKALQEYRRHLSPAGGGRGWIKDFVIGNHLIKNSRTMKTVIVYYSFSGNNELLAKKLQSLLNCQMMKINEQKKRTNFSIMLDIIFKRSPKLEAPALQIADFEYIIFVAPIWAGRIASPLKAFIKSLDKKLGKYSFISLCGSSDNGKVVSELASLTGRKPFKLLEIAANDLAPAGISVKQTSSYRVTGEDLLKVDKILHSFIDHTELIADTASA